MNTVRPLVESLESRRLLAADPASVAVDPQGTLVVNGSNKADHVVISLSAESAEVLEVNLNGTVIPFAVAQVTNGIHVMGGNGKDVVTIDETNGPVLITAHLEGGNGADSLTGGSAGDILNGGNGKDTLVGGGGADHLTGGRGKDSSTGSEDNDVFAGDKASEVVDLADGDVLMEPERGKRA